jgi:cytochrome b subunit of formate dehydrogenase
MRTDAPTMVLHWALVLTLLLSLASGLRIMADAQDTTISHAMRPILLQGAVVDWHVASAFCLTALVIAYVVFLWRARLGSRVAPDLGAVASPDRTARWTALNRVLYWVAFGLLLIGAVTGALLYFTPYLLPTQTVTALHGFAAWGLILYVPLHIAAQLALGGMRQLAKILTPRAAYGGAAALAAGTAVIMLASVVYPSSEAMTGRLRIAFVDLPPIVDGHPHDAAWSRASAVEIHTFQGANLAGGESTVRVRGVHDSEHAYLLFEWSDPTRSQKHLPLVKLDAGWRLMESRYALNDENQFYEDKFAVMLSRSAKIGGGATQLGHRPLGDKPGPAHERGLHYTTDGSFVDVWHWKSVRTGPLGQLDDNHFGPPLGLPDKVDARYTGGYTQDPKAAGGFIENWKKMADSAFVEPKRLPRDLAALHSRMGSLDLDPQAADHGEWWMRLTDTVPYSKEADSYPVGTVIPSVLIDKPFEGDRGDVSAAASWKDGWWRLETKRKLDTKSRYDVPIETGIHLWVAVFDHNQSRHTRHLHPVRIVMEK